MKTSLNDLNEYLFKQLEVITNDDLKGDALKEEIKRSNAVTGIANTIINNASLVLQAKKHADQYGNQNSMPNVLSLKDE